MASVKQIIRDIKEQKVATTGRRVLLVEGADDVTAFQNFLSRKFPAWEQDWILAPAGSKKNVLEALALEANWLGVVDRDAWTDEQIAEKRRNLANLLVLPRFCIESYLIVPEELWLGFQPKHQQAINGGIQAFIQAVHDVLPQWRNHAALWNVIHPLWNGCALPVLILRFMTLIQHRMMLKLNNAYGSGANIWIPMPY
ncbi:putative cytoplasmic protein [Salmonella enterica subsp. enterica]|uniref:Putative cytoplasmic protein n=1 Tax=Salmonella enterica I TaxID=59201 RepID=A0A379V0J4_SALET|nr:putative cytoplasmic protein [Salmonella enterica subsp. enterica]